jgi:hypothetical protein
LKEKQILEAQVYSKIWKLFEDQEELLHELTQYLPQDKQEKKGVTKEVPPPSKVMVKVTRQKRPATAPPIITQKPKVGASSYNEIIYILPPEAFASGGELSFLQKVKFSSYIKQLTEYMTPAILSHFTIFFDPKTLLSKIG